jgi:hypothetical protein
MSSVELNLKLTDGRLSDFHGFRQFKNKTEFICLNKQLNFLCIAIVVARMEVSD